MGRMAWICPVVFLAAGCVQRTMTITSDPPGALVYMNNQEIGRTPVTRDFTWYGTYDVQVRMDGYQTLDTKTRVIAPVWQWPPLDLLAELWPGRLEDHHNLAYTLRPVEGEAADTAEMLAHAEELRGKLQSSKHTREPTTAPSR